MNMKYMNVPNKDRIKKQVDELKHHDFKALFGVMFKTTPKRGHVWQGSHDHEAWKKRMNHVELGLKIVWDL